MAYGSSRWCIKLAISEERKWDGREFYRQAEPVRLTLVSARLCRCPAEPGGPVSTSDSSDRSSLWRGALGGAGRRTSGAGSCTGSPASRCVSASCRSSSWSRSCSCCTACSYSRSLPVRRSSRWIRPASRRCSSPISRCADWNLRSSCSAACRWASSELWWLAASSRAASRLCSYGARRSRASESCRRSSWELEREDSSSPIYGRDAVR